jgi:DNA-binding beta-propeller fold protein YncE
VSRRRVPSIAVLTLLTFFGAVSPASAQVPFTAYTLDSREMPVAIPKPYVRDLELTGHGDESGPFASPNDLFVDEAGSVYLVDTGLDRILKYDRDARLQRIFGKEMGLKQPQGLFVAPGGDLYVADTGNGRIVHATADGTTLREYRRPEAAALENGQPFQPAKLVVDRRGYLYVLEAGFTSGIIVLDQDGNFRGFFGATRLELDLGRLFINLFATAEQRRQLFAPEPVPHSNVLMDDGGFLYTVVGSGRTDQIQKLSPVGINIFRPSLEADKHKFFGERMVVSNRPALPKFVDLAVDRFGVVTAVEQISGRIYQYDQSRRLLAVFGGIGKGPEQFEFPVSMAVDPLGRLYVLDGKRNAVYRLRPTRFAELVHEASQLYNDGRYEEAADLWREVLRYHAQYEPAHVGIGKAERRQERHAPAMAEFELAGDRDGYSAAFEEGRYEWLRRHFGELAAATGAGLLGVIALAGPVRRRLRAADRRRLLADAPPLDAWQLALGVLRRPQEALYEMREHGSLWAVPVLLLLACLVRVATLWLLAFHMVKNPEMNYFWDYLLPFNLLTHYHLREIDPDQITIVLEVMRVLLPWAAWVLVSHGLGAIFDGEATFPAILRSTSYALLPYILFAPVVIGLTHVLARDERWVVNVLLSGVYTWCAALLFLQFKVVHDFAVGRSLRIAVTTLFAMVLLFGFGGFLYLVTTQVLRFGWEVLYEVSTL